MSVARLSLVLAAAVLAGGCGLFRTKSKITVPQLLTPVVESDLERLIQEINRQASVRSLSGRVDIQFLDTSFAECGVADLYRTVEGRVVAQRPGQIYLLVQAPFGIKIAEMSSNGERFWAALYQGDQKYQRFVTGTNNAAYQKLEANGGAVDCRGKSGKAREAAMQRATVSALSSLRPQHFSDALLVRPAAAEGSNLIYALAETFEEEPDTRPAAKKGARVVRAYYVISEMEPRGANRAHVLRRLWFDRVGAIRLARVQTYNERSQLVTDIVYNNPQAFGEGGGHRLPAQVELTRPQDRYAIRVAFQDPAAVEVDEPRDPEVFVLKNTANLPAVDLDARRR